MTSGGGCDISVFEGGSRRRGKSAGRCKEGYTTSSREFIENSMRIAQRVSGPEGKGVFKERERGKKRSRSEARGGRARVARSAAKA